MVEARRLGLPALAAIALFIGWVGSAAAFEPLHWRSLGPFRGGRVLAVAADPDRPLVFYFGAVDGGVWKSGDAGRTWSPIFDADGVGSIGAMALAPSAPDTIYVGTGEADMRSDIAIGAGVFKSVDGGASFSFVGLKDTQAIGQILVDPHDPNTVLVAALGHPYGPNAERGVFRSADGGRTWTRTLFKDENTGAIDLAFAPGDARIVYAAMWQTRRPPWNAYGPSSGPGGGLYRSEDGGLTWTRLGGFPENAGRIGLAVSRARPASLWALADGPSGGLWRSNDEGATWKQITADKRIIERAWYFQGLTVDPDDPDRIFVCNTVVYRSDDGGRTFAPVKGDYTGDDFHTLVIDPARPQRRILGTDQGALVSLNGGRTWSSWLNQPTGQFYHVVTDNRFPYWVYGAQQDSGAAAVPSRTVGVDGIVLRDFHEGVPGGESGEIAPDPDDPDIVFGGRVQRYDGHTGQDREVDPTLAFEGDWRATWTLPLTFSKTGAKTLYFANQKIFATIDAGAHWRAISPDLTRATPVIPSNLDPPTIADVPTVGPRRGVVYTLAPSPLRPQMIWAGTDDGLLWLTRDGGGHWDNVTPAALGPWSKIGAIEPSHFDPLTAYIAVDRHRLDDFRPYIFATHDGGRSWRLIVRGIASGNGLDAVNVVREDIRRPGLLFAGTETGLFASSDDGATWAALDAGLPPTSVRDLQVHGDDLVIATHGRGFYVMDDIAPLRALGLGARPADALLPPAPAVRFREARFTGTPMPKDEPMAPNPPAGAYIDYTLATPAAGPVEIDIRAGDGSLVRRYSSADHPPVNPYAAVVAPEWLPRPERVAVSAGLHRLVWDERYAAAVPGGEGVWAPPGRYEVTLTANGRTYERPLEVRPDPRVKASAADYAAEFALARRIEAMQARLAALPKGAGKANGADQFPQTPAARLGDRLTALMTAVDGADGAPTPDARAGVDLAQRDLDTLVAPGGPAR
ncbi:MAG TPA: hypothetical protein VGS12_16430 [Caulobacteraceae bacterium]|nr:hypothetical protein [Caulobacteraceae bacterium]